MDETSSYGKFQNGAKFSLASHLNFDGVFFHIEFPGLLHQLRYHIDLFSSYLFSKSDWNLKTFAAALDLFHQQKKEKCVPGYFIFGHFAPFFCQRQAGYSTCLLYTSSLAHGKAVNPDSNLTRLVHGVHSNKKHKDLCSYSFKFMSL